MKHNIAHVPQRLYFWLSTSYLIHVQLCRKPQKNSLIYLFLHVHTLLSAYYSFQIWLLGTKVIIPEFYDSITKIYLSISCFPKKNCHGFEPDSGSSYSNTFILFISSCLPFFQERQLSLPCCKLTRHRNCLKAFVAGIQLLSIHCDCSLYD